MPHGRDPDIQDEQFAAFAADVRDALAEEPDEKTARRHLSAMRYAAAEAAAFSDRRARMAPRGAGPRRGGRRGRPALRLAALGAGALIAFSGTSTVLAAAGVELPEAVRAPFDAVGVDLPNQNGNEPPRGPDERAAPGDPGEPARSGRDGAPGQTKAKKQGGNKNSENRGRRSEDGPGRSEDAPGARNDEAPGRTGAPRDGTNRGRSDEAPAHGRSGTPSGGRRDATRSRRPAPKSQPANPAPRKSADRGAGPARPIKPTTPQHIPPERNTTPGPVKDQTTTTPEALP